jgi:hypothetical protein
MSTKLVRDLAGSEALNLLMTGDNTNGWSLTSAASEKTLLTSSGTASSSGDNTLISAPGAGVKLVIVGVTLQLEGSTATTLRLTNGAGGSTISRVLAQNQGDGLALTFPIDARPKLSTNIALVLNLSGANACGYTIWYYTE